MELNKESACKILRDAEKLQDIFSESVNFVISKEDVDIAAAYRKAAGYYMGNVVTNIMMPIWQMYPELKPERLNEPYETPQRAEFSPESRAKIENCIHEAQKMKHLIESSMSSKAREEQLAYGGLEEVSAMLGKINELLAKYNNENIQ